MAIQEIEIAVAIADNLSRRTERRAREGKPRIGLTLTIREARAVCMAIERARGTNG